MQPILLSSSSLASFMRCRKQYYYQYELLLDGGQTDAMATGTSVHKELEQAAVEGPFYEGGPIVAPYLEEHPLPENIISAETPTWIKLLDKNSATETDVWLRCTFDLVYRKGDEVVIRDYKTFSRAPSLDADLDFQGKLYTTVGHKLWGDCHFEYEYIRSTPPGVVKDKSGGMWTPEECYFNVPVYADTPEIDSLWQDAQDIARDLVRARQEGRWYRQPRRSLNGVMCGDCMLKTVCESDFMQGGLDPQNIELLANKRKPLELPEGLR